MGMFDIFKSKKEEEYEIDIALKDIEIKDMLDFEANTYTVEKKYHNHYGATKTTEWQLKSADGQALIYLEMEDDDEVEWSVSRKAEFSELGIDKNEFILNLSSRLSRVELFKTINSSAGSVPRFAVSWTSTRPIIIIFLFQGSNPCFTSKKRGKTTKKKEASQY